MEAIVPYMTPALVVLATIVSNQNLPFVILFVFRYLRLIVHMISFWLYKPYPVASNPTFGPQDCTVIIPTIDPDNEDFAECLTSVLANNPGEVLIVTVGERMLQRTREIAAQYSPNIRVTATNVANKRSQVCHAVPDVRTLITVLVDDHVFWPSSNFLPTLLAPFEDPQVGVVGTNKRVRRFDHGYSFRDFWNFIGCIYLERHNFEICATNNIDGGVFVVSGRTAAHRTQILQEPEFIRGFTNEMFFFGKYGPLNADDDNFITRWQISHGWKIRIQYSEDAMIETTLGTYPKFLSQCLRWVRTTWRSNSASLFTDRTVWRVQPWCVYAVYISSFFNFALFYDAALLYFATTTTLGSADKATALKLMGAWIFASKLVKLAPHFWRNPGDLIYLPGYILFAYYHSLIKLYAGLTFWVTAWGGRDLAAASADPPPPSEDPGRQGGVGGPTGPQEGPGDDSDSGSSSSILTPKSYACIKTSRASPRGSPRGNPAPTSTISTSWGKIHSPSRVPTYMMAANVLESTMSNVSTASRRTSPAKSPTSAPIATPKRCTATVTAYPTPAATVFGTPTTDSVGCEASTQTSINEVPILAATAASTGAKRVTSIVPPYQRKWVRGERCERLHYDGHNVMKNRCVLGDADLSATLPL